MSATETIAAFAAGLDVTSIPREVRHAAKLHLLDTLGCALAASGLGQATAGREIAAADGDGGPATVIGLPGGYPAASAALANGMLAHALDFDDTHARSICHISTVVVPAALAAAEAAHVSGAELLAALVAGSEVVARLGAAASGEFHARGLHPTSVCGVFGAATAAARLHRLDPERMMRALGLAGSMSSGLFEYLSDGSQTKPVHAGWAAHGGVMATELARRGAAGPASVLEGRFGLFAAYLDHRDVDLDTELADLGKRWETPLIDFKAYPACHFIHGALGALDELLDQSRGASVGESDKGKTVAPPRSGVSGPLVDDPMTLIDSVVVTVPEGAVPIVLEPLAEKRRPRTEYEAKFSLPYSLAARLLSGAVGVRTYQEPLVSDPQIRLLAQRVTYETGEFASYPGAFPGGVKVTLRDGTVLENACVYQKGSSENPLRGDEIVAKFRANAELGGLADAAEDLRDRVMVLEEQLGAGDLLRALRDAAAMGWMSGTGGRSGRGAAGSERRRGEG